mmetsp:Transcript_168709/g.542157  ORF Transcript_168709/g.542157 Transcript_168709/m.542157 type:complete len:500 (+) Transcript_168709:67-1566(+)|eukprot:CAMPEP_0203871418 /NCGR_PEP_ID=MMETSP0359-20131031/18726_1 /ASSEMBLY_ACC=CAM_ASM_000338 /TAXON_ID=268821 /ORGANISM="Scrippsiella Hangoei, Strain SHTV-5" /LENGTH=499 /DNA_ID=CAMNT_0050790093 /DNA_START=66 /DNA_END=1565 /DNA_ORIENTATION=+
MDIAAVIALPPAPAFAVAGSSPARIGSLQRGPSVVGAATPPVASASSGTSSALAAFGLGLASASAAASARRQARRGAATGQRRPRAGAVAVAAATDVATETVKWQAAAETSLLNNYGKRSLTMERGEGHYLFDVDGRKFLDFTAGIAVNCLGHSDPGWVEVVAKHAGTLCHTSNLFLNKEQITLGEKLVKCSFADKAFFCNSGTEASEAAIKFSRKFHMMSGKPRTNFVCFDNAFHGRTMGALALTYKEAYKTPFQPTMPSSSFLPFNDAAALGAIDDTVCAVFVEPMQGEGGVIPATNAFMEALRKRCDEVGALLVFDEVQCGLGRTGKLFGYQMSGVLPDIMTLAKPLAGGLPIGAVLMTERIAECIVPGDHGSTFAGAPLVCAAGNYTFDRISNPAFLANVCEMGERIRAGLRRLGEPRGLTVRGEGLLCGLVFEDAAPCGAVQKAAQEMGLLVLTAGKGNVLRIAPALTVGPKEVDEFLDLLEKSMVHALDATKE